jgi:hypothetical protein
LTIRSHPVASGTGEHARVGGKPRRERLRSAAPADHAGARRFEAREDLLVGVEAQHAAVAKDERVHGVAFGLVTGRDHLLLERDRHVRAREPERAESNDRSQDVVHLERVIAPVEAARGKGRVLHARRQRLRNRSAEQGDVRGRHS